MRRLTTAQALGVLQGLGMDRYVVQVEPAGTTTLRLVSFHGLDGEESADRLNVRYTDGDGVQRDGKLTDMVRDRLRLPRRQSVKRARRA